MSPKLWEMKQDIKGNSFIFQYGINEEDIEYVLSNIEDFIGSGV
jgi:hypothetical protein